MRLAWRDMDAEKRVRALVTLQEMESAEGLFADLTRDMELLCGRILLGTSLFGELDESEANATRLKLQAAHGAIKGIHRILEEWKPQTDHSYFLDEGTRVESETPETHEEAEAARARIEARVTSTTG